MIDGSAIIMAALSCFHPLIIIEWHFLRIFVQSLTSWFHKKFKYVLIHPNIYLLCVLSLLLIFLFAFHLFQHMHAQRRREFIRANEKQLARLRKSNKKQQRDHKRKSAGGIAEDRLAPIRETVRSFLKIHTFKIMLHLANIVFQIVEVLHTAVD